MRLNNKIPILLMFPVAALAIYFIGGRVVDVQSQIVSASRQWLLIFLGVYGVNFILAWFLKNAWTPALIRLLGCGLFAYVAISELVDTVGGMWGHLHQLLGGEGTLDDTVVNAVRYTVTAWTVGLTMMVVCIAIGFESGKDAE
ncbi:MAG: hypothetical protein JXX14_01490 [Deltaproteobacteria bacterium]|nr:hypothetical protein [Deltaproteobacteria bacterium]